MSSCRICGAALPENPLLEYPNMPARAQHLPDRPDGEAVDLRLFECPACGVLQLTGAPVTYFREVIRAVGVSKPMRAFRLRQFRQWLRRYDLAGAPVLECGCGRGEYLALMREAGAEAVGMEGGDSSCAAARQAGLTVENGYFDTGCERLAHAPFDGFFMLNYLEHIPDPRTYFCGVRANLAPRAVGLLEVPNFDMMLRERLFAEFTLDHLYYFTAASLRRVLEMNGFEVLRCRTVWYDYIISAEVRLREAFDPAPFRRAGEALHAALEQFVSQWAPDEIAVWGAGHQAFALLAWAGLGKRIRCVIDSAAFKQGRFTPASGVPIVAPSVLDDGRIKAVLVMAGSYSGEIAALIRAKYADRCHIALLCGNEIKRY